MFRWRKKNEGFEWREYVRTTILVRRRQRQEKFDEAKQAALDGIKDAGRRGAAAGQAGAKSAGHAMSNGLAAIGRAPGHAWTFLKPRLASSLSSFQAWARKATRIVGSSATHGLASAAAATGRGLRRLGVWLAAVLREPLARLASGADILRRPEVHLGLLLAGSIAPLSFVAGLFSRGFTSETLATGAIAVVALVLAAIPKLVDRHGGAAAPFDLSSVFGDIRDRYDDLHTRFRPDLKGSVAVGVAAALFVGGVAYFARGETSPISSLLSSSEPATPLEGRAVAISGGSLRIGHTVVRLAGIEAPEIQQTCLKDSGKRWHCGTAARDALSRLVRRRSVTCDVPASTGAATVEGSCTVRGIDLASELVRQGHVFATVGLFSRYSGLEGEARAAKLGVWQGDADRPADYRAKLWDEASRSAPDGCPIKGNVTSSGRVYVLPWSRGYDRARVREARGERWFCSESEAQAAGWEPTNRS
jgi:endonuclease YncB( thermonuclease family)